MVKIKVKEFFFLISLLFLVIFILFSLFVLLFFLRFQKKEQQMILQFFSKRLFQFYFCKSMSFKPLERKVIPRIKKQISHTLEGGAD